MGSEDPVAERAISQPQDRCVSSATVEQLKIMIFDSARRFSSSDPVRLNDLQRQSTATVEMPLLDAHDEALDRTTCSGRLRIEVPIGARSIFGPDELVADISYSIQPAADGSGLVYQVDDFGRVARSIGYADLSRFNQSRSDGSVGSVFPEPVEPPAYAKVGRASFDCRLARTSVEHMICADPELGELDLQMASAYAQRRQEQAGSGSEQLAWISARNNCTDRSCLSRAYQVRIAQLSE
jgi:hypothetical protein